MSQQPFVVWDPDPTQNEKAVFDQPMEIETNAGSVACVRHSCFPVARQGCSAVFKK
jgi:hypothetical protein